MAKLTKEVMDGLIKELKTYMPERVTALIAKEHGVDTEVSEEQVNETLAEFFQKEQDLVSDRSLKGREANKIATAGMLGRQNVISEREKLRKGDPKKPVPFDLKEYNRQIAGQKAKAAQGGDAKAKIELAKSKTVVETTASALSKMYVSKVAATFGERPGSVEFTQDLEALMKLDARIGAEVLAAATQEETTAKSTSTSWLSAALKYVSDGATRAQNAMYRGLVYKIAKWEVQADQEVGAFAGTKLREHINEAKATEVFKKDMARRADRVGSDYAAEVKEAHNVITQLNLHFAKGGEKKDPRWLVTLVFNAVTAAKKVEEEPAVKVGDISRMDPSTLKSTLEPGRYKAPMLDLTKVPTAVKEQGAKAHSLAGMGAEAAEAAKRRGSSTTPLAQHTSDKKKEGPKVPERPTPASKAKHLSKGRGNSFDKS